jgi:hypothetical protein
VTWLEGAARAVSDKAKRSAIPGAHPLISPYLLAKCRRVASLARGAPPPASELDHAHQILPLQQFVRR